MTDWQPIATAPERRKVHEMTVAKGLLLVAATILFPALVQFVVEHEDPSTSEERKR